MSELDELIFGKSKAELEIELQYQLSQGESLGGTICSEIVYAIDVSS